MNEQDPWMNGAQVVDESSKSQNTIKNMKRAKKQISVANLLNWFEVQETSNLCNYLFPVNLTWN